MKDKKNRFENVLVPREMGKIRGGMNKTELVKSIAEKAEDTKPKEPVKK